MKKKVESSAVFAMAKAGFNLTQIARKLKVSVEAVRKRIASLKRQGVLKQVSRCPALFVEITPRRADTLLANTYPHTFNQRPTSDNPLRTAEPHRFGFTYLLKRGKVRGRVAWSFKGGDVRSWKNGEFSIQAFKHRVVFWLKAFKGVLTGEQVELGKKQLRERAARFAREQSVVLEFEKENCPREWAVPRGPGSNKLISELGLKEGARRVGDVELLTDKSHPERAEVRDAVGAVAGSADKFAAGLDVVKKLPDIFPGLEKIAAQADNIERVGVLIQEMQRPIKPRNWRDGL